MMTMTETIRNEVNRLVEREYETSGRLSNMDFARRVLEAEKLMRKSVK